MIKIVFVDDEPAVLASLQNRMQCMHDSWQMHFVLGAECALAELDAAPFDVIVSDLRMPGMDGDRLLVTVRDRHPQMLRLIMAGGSGEESTVRPIAQAHQVLSKSCEAPALERCIDRISGLHSRLKLPALDKAMDVLNRLPCLPRLYWALLEEIEKPNSTAVSIAEIIEQDIAMTARLLQMANSAFFGSGRRVNTVKDAICLLGLLPVRSIVVQLHLFRAMDTETLADFSVQDLQQHSLKIGRLASRMLRDSEARQIAFSAGMLHDIGYLALMMGAPEECAAVKAQVTQSGQALVEVEREIIGCDHAEIGAHLLNLWGLPLPLIESVAYHHAPAASGESRFGVTAALHVANVLDAERGEGAAFAEGGLDTEFIAKLGVKDTVAAWRRGEPVLGI